MRPYLSLLTCAAIIPFTLTTCISKPRKGLPTATGGVGEVLIVCDDQLWNAGVNKGLKHSLSKTFPMLLQKEPLFTFTRVGERNFTDLLKRNRKLMMLQKTAKNTFGEIKNKYAKPQVLFRITGKDIDEINMLLFKFKDSINDAYHRSEIDYLQEKIKNANQSDDAGLKKMGVYLEVPSEYMHIVDTTGFQWFRKNTLKGFYNLIVYESPWNRKSFINKADMIAMRDSCSGKFVEGRVLGSHMITENRSGLGPEIKTIQQATQSTIEMRGFWKMSGGEFLGGTFLSYSYIDRKQKRLLTAEGFVFAPNQKKRNMMIQLEAILKTFRLKTPQERSTHTN